MILKTSLYCLSCLLLFSCSKDYSFEGGPDLIDNGPPVDTVQVVPTTNPDYFPLTENSRWIYDDMTFPGDSVIRSFLAPTTIENLPYEEWNEFKSFYPANNKQYYRKTGDNYYRYTSASGFTSYLNFSPSIYDHLNFLKETLTTGETWYSPDYQGRTSVGIQVKLLRYQFRCVDANATVTVNGNTFAHVYVVQMRPEVCDPGGIPQPTGEMHTLYYAKGIGLIYSLFYNTIKTHEVLKIRKWIIQ